MVTLTNSAVIDLLDHSLTASPFGKYADDLCAAFDLRATVIPRLEDSGIQSDQRFTEARVRQRAVQGYGPLRIRAELTQAGISRDDTEAALGEAYTDWTEQAWSLIQRRFPKASEDRNEALRAWRWLAGRGFDGGAIRAALRDVEDVDRAP